MSALTPRIDAIEGQALIAGSNFQGLPALIDSSPSNMIPVPFTTIIGRAPIVNLANDVCVNMGVKRIYTQYIQHVASEGGPSGEPIYSVRNDLLGQIRFGGHWKQSAGGNGNSPYSSASTSNQGDFIEVTFYGTGLALLTVNHNSTDLRYSVDGGSENGSTILPASNSQLSSQIANTYVIFPVVNNLAQGLHTVKLRIVSSGGDLLPYGFDILNETSTLVVNPGLIHGFNKTNSLSTRQNVSYNSGFESGTLGTKGGRVLVYLRSDGSIGKAVTPVPNSPSFLSSTDHTNEEILRISHFREFGTNRSDDFNNMGMNQSTGVNSINYVLDDNSTILTGDRVSGKTSPIGGVPYVDVIAPYTNSSVTFQFVGTGCDIWQSGGTAGSDTFAVTVDGTNVGNLVGTTTCPLLNRIVSGLPYGSHTVKVSMTTPSSEYFNPFKFVAYGPKKPTLPSGAVELADYNIVANFVANSTQGLLTMSQGVVRKSNAREFLIFGSGWSFGGVSLVDVSGFALNTTTDGDSVQYSFWGTGFDMRFNTPSGGSPCTCSVTVDSLALTTTNFASLVASTYAANTSYSTSTAVLTLNDGGSGSNLAGAGFYASGLALGWHTVKITKTAGSGQGFAPDSFDIITPIHSVQNNYPFTTGSNFTVGNTSIHDSRVLAAKKAFTQTVGVYSTNFTVNSTYRGVPNLCGVIDLKQDGELDISVHSAFSLNNTGVNLRCYVAVDGIVYGDGFGGNWGTILNYTSNLIFQFNIPSILVNVSKGQHFVQVYVESDSNTLTLVGGYSILTVRER